MIVKKRERATRAMVTRVVGKEEGNSDGGNIVRNNNDSLMLSCSSLSCAWSPLLTMRATTSRTDDEFCMHSARTTSAMTERRRL